MKLNHEELFRIVSGRSAAHELEANELIDLGLEIREEYGIGELLVTRAERGAILLSASGDAITRQAPPVERFVDAVGAGDAFTAGYLSGRLLQLEPDACLERALLLGSRMCEVRGATTHDRSIYKGIEVRKLQP